MAKTIKVKLLRGIVLEGAKDRNEQPTYGEVGKSYDLDLWLGKYLIGAGAAEEVKGK